MFATAFDSGKNAISITNLTKAIAAFAHHPSPVTTAAISDEKVAIALDSTNFFCYAEVDKEELFSNTT